MTPSQSSSVLRSSSWECTSFIPAGSVLIAVTCTDALLRALRTHAGNSASAPARLSSAEASGRVRVSFIRSWSSCSMRAARRLRTTSARRVIRRFRRAAAIVNRQTSGPPARATCSRRTRHSASTSCRALSLSSTGASGFAPGNTSSRRLSSSAPLTRSTVSTSDQRRAPPALVPYPERFCCFSSHLYSGGIEGGSWTTEEPPPAPP